MISFFVAGIPRPGGSKTAMPIYNRTGHAVTTMTATGKHRPVLRYVDDAKGNSEWRKAVALFGRQAWGIQAPMEGPLGIRVTFYLSRPQYHYGTGRNKKVVKDRAPKYSTAKPDLTKLMRSTEDALKGILWTDDAQICRQELEKRYTANQPGARVEAWGIEEAIPQSWLPVADPNAPQEKKPYDNPPRLLHAGKAPHAWLDASRQGIRKPRRR